MPTIKNDAVRRQVLLEGLKANEAQKFTKFLKELDVSLRQRLAAEGPTIFNKQRLQVLLADVTKIQQGIFDKFTGEFEAGLDDLALQEAMLEAKLVNAVTKPAFESILPSPVQIKAAALDSPLALGGRAAGLTLKPFVKDFSVEQIRLLNSKITQGFAQGQTVPDILKAIRGTAANGFADGALANVNKNAQIMVRTAVQNVSSAARQKVWEENSDLVVGVEWVSTLDSRTTEQCQMLDGEIFPVDSGIRPPAHYGCRSTTAPVLRESARALQEGAQRPSKGENAAGNLKIQQVSAKTTYYEWLKTQPADFVQKVLGDDRGLLFLNGGLSAEKFKALQLGQNFKPLTLKEMGQIAPQAFEKAFAGNPAAIDKYTK